MLLVMGKEGSLVVAGDVPLGVAESPVACVNIEYLS